MRRAALLRVLTFIMKCAYNIYASRKLFAHDKELLFRVLCRPDQLAGRELPNQKKAR